MSLLKQLKPVLPQLQDAFLSFPKMPANEHGLSNGDIIRCETDDLGCFARRGQEFPIFFDGDVVRCSPPGEDGSVSGPSWSVEQLGQEIHERKWWSISGSLFESDYEKKG